MKRFVLLIGLIAGMGAVLFAQNTALPRLAVVVFTTNDNVDKTRQNAATVRNLVEAQMISSGRFQMITRGDIDKLLENQRIQVSSISSAENIRKLQMENINYIVTGSVDAMGDDYVVTVNVLDVSTGRFSHSADDFMGGSSRELYDGVRGLMTRFISGMQMDSSGSIMRTQSLVANNAQSHLERGKVFFDREDYANAISELNEAIKLDSNLAEAYAYRSRAYDNPDQKLSDANAAIRLNPNLAIAYHARGNAYRDKKDWERAITDYAQAIRLDPNFAWAYVNRGNVYIEKKDWDRAIVDYTQVVKLNPNFALAYTNRGWSYHNKGDYDKAISDYTQAVRLDPNFTQAYINRGVLYHDIKKDYDRAIVDLEAALRIEPNNAKIKGALDTAKRRGR